MRIGGIERLSTVAGKLVPIMAVACIAAALPVPIINFDAIPAVFALIFKHAFTPVAATGGIAGAAVWAAIRFGVARGVFSNEASARRRSPMRRPRPRGRSVRIWLPCSAPSSTRIDTIVVCTFTAPAIIRTGAWTGGETGAALTSHAFDIALPGFGGYITAIAPAVFAFTTILGWSYHCERSLQYLFGVRIIKPFRAVWSLAALVGATLKLGLVWLLADTLNALMATPDLVAPALSSPIVFKITKEFLETGAGRKTTRSDAARRAEKGLLDVDPGAGRRDDHGGDLRCPSNTRGMLQRP